MQRSSGTLGDWGGPASLSAPPRGFPLLAASALSLYENEVPGAFKPLKPARPHGPQGHMVPGVGLAFSGTILWF